MAEHFTGVLSANPLVNDIVLATEEFTRLLEVEKKYQAYEGAQSLAATLDKDGDGIVKEGELADANVTLCKLVLKLNKDADQFSALWKYSFCQCSED